MQYFVGRDNFVKQNKKVSDINNGLIIRAFTREMLHAEKNATLFIHCIV